MTALVLGYMRTRRADAYAESIAMRAPIYTPRRDWRARAVCTDAPPAWFFEQQHRGRALCATCPVRIDCAATAIQTENANNTPSDMIAGYFGVSAKLRAAHRGHTSERPSMRPAGRVGYPMADVAAIATHAHQAGVRMAAAVAEHFAMSERTATNVIYRARKAGHEIPYDRKVVAA